MVYYLWTLTRAKNSLEEREKELTKKENKLESDYRQIIDNTLIKERKILEDAAKQASTILSNTQYVSSASKELIDKALEKMIVDIQKEAEISSNDSMANYKNFLNQLSGKSLENFQNITKSFEADMEKQMQEFGKSLLPGVQKEIEAYKLQRFSEADKKINKIVQLVSQKVLNKSVSLEDHQKLIIESLEKSRKEGVFD